MAFDARNFIIERLTRGVMFDTASNSVLWSINQIKDPSLNVTTEENEVVDALDSPIMAFERGKRAEFSGSNALFDIALAAAQSGTIKKVATSTAKFRIPIFDEIEIPQGGATVSLSKIPVGTGAAALPYLYKLNGDGSLAEQFEYAVTASATAFTFADKELTLPTSGIVAGDTILAMYEYEADGTDGNGAVGFDADATKFAQAGKLWVEGIFYNPCDPSTKHYGVLLFPNAKLSSVFELSFTSDGGHPFTIKCNQNYCDKNKRLFSIQISE